MADTVDTTASRSADEAKTRQDGSPAHVAEELGDAAPLKEPPEPPGAAPENEADEPQAPKDEAGEPEETPPVTALFEQLASELSELGTSEAQLEAARHMPEVRRSARDLAGALVVVIAGLAAFAFLNVAAMDGLSRVLDPWLAALVIAAVWLVVVGVLLFGLMGRARRWLLWIVLKEPPAKALDELARERDAAGSAARSTLEHLGPALAMQIALAAMPKAEDVASGVVEAGDTVLDASDEIVAEITEELPGGGAVKQVWAVALAPGRFGIKVATTVLRRGRPPGDVTTR